jgi:hypothetical protein
MRSILLSAAAWVLAASAVAEELDLGAMVQRVPPDSKFSDPNYYVWCGAPVKGTDGRYHLFYSRWPKNNPNKFAPGWAIVSEVAYAVGDGPRGPFTHVNVALPARGINPATGAKYWDADMTHNPYIILKGGTYYLYYIGNFGDGTYAVHRNNDRIGVAHATNPAGPWTRLDQPVIDITPDPAGSTAAFDSLCVANPAITVMPDGKMLVLYKGVKNSGSLMGGPVRHGAAIADSPTGSYIKQTAVAGQIFLPPGASNMEAEDAFIWYSPRYGNRYYAVARDVVGTFTGVSGGLAQFQSDDGLHWTASAQPKVLGSSFTWTSGISRTTRVERPFVLLENDLPVALYGATDGYDPGGRLSFNVHIPLLAPPTVRITSPSAVAVTLADTQTRLKLTAEADSAFGVPVLSWSQLSGPASANIYNTTATTTSVAFPADGVYVLACSVTDTAGTATDQVTVALNSPLTISLRQGFNGYSHTAAMIRGDNPTWNGGARDQLLIGRWTGKGMRAVFSFPLTGIPSDSIVHSTSLDLWTTGVSSSVPVKALQLKQLAATPTEGTGNGQNSTAATSGVTWNHRTAQPDPGIAWSAAGGDITTQVSDELTEYADTAANLPLSFSSSTAFVTATQAAVSAGSPLDLALISPLTEGATTDALTRIASDDHASAGLRPRLNVTFTGNFAPVIDPGTASAATRAVPAPLMASVSHADSVIWKLLSGPGAVMFSDVDSAATSATFSGAGTYQIELVASNALTESNRPLEVSVAPNPAFFADWQSITWPGITGAETTSANSDPDGDGIVNLLEWALSLDARLPDTIPANLVKNGEFYTYTYTRRKTQPAAADFKPEWSDTLGNNWSTSGVTSLPPVTIDDTSESVTATVPAGSGGARFVRLRVSAP